ncbi:SMI1/KNR4 family protein [Enterocloster clostridioformis]|uniref:SMI1/KNR4 family protein n=1 Tax=Enterocloster clostridioformis TaxID=1531 RepID=UPI0004123F1C|nr:SMI1/KNR4 family protein [Enterocloster clostridioformis]
MDILNNLNERLSFDEKDVHAGGEDKIKMVLNKAPFNLPKDYIEFLETISGDENDGISFFTDMENGGYGEIVIWAAEGALRTNLEDLNFPIYKKFLEEAWVIGNDLGDIVYFYGVGNAGFGIYRSGAGSLGFDVAEKIADSLTAFLVGGVGIDIAITL